MIAGGNSDEMRLAELAERYEAQLAAGIVPSTELEAVDPQLAACLRALHRHWTKSTFGDHQHRHSRDVTTQQIGRFRLKELIGSGGFGVVYLAFDPVLKRQVALKVPQLVSLLDARLREQFVQEGQAAARLHHPNIVPIYESGSDGEICYLAAAYCAGPNLACWLADHHEPLSARRAAALLLPIADAVEHAHHHGVVHRDIKPQNILLDPEVASGEFPFTPKLTDFGIARLDNCDPAAAGEGLVLGTPGYMAPELAAESGQPGPASDIYALGAVLYGMLTGRPPIAGTDSADTLRRIVTDSPQRVTQLAPHVPADLAAIVHKSLEKLPEQRYLSAGELADDLRQFLAGLPTRARPLTTWQRAGRSVRQNPMAAGLIGTVLVAVCGFAATISLHNIRLEGLNAALTSTLDEVRHARDQVQKSEERSRMLLNAADIDLAHRAWKEHESDRLDFLLARHRTGPGQPGRPGFEWHFLNKHSHLPRQLLAGPGPPLNAVCFSPNGSLIAAAGETGFIALYDARTGKRASQFATDRHRVDALAFSPDGTRIASATQNGRIVVFELGTGRELLTFDVPSQSVESLLWSPDSSRLISCGGESAIRIWDSSSGDQRDELMAHADHVTRLALSEDGSHLISGDMQGRVLTWDVATKQVAHRLRCGTHPVTSVDVSSDGRLIVAANLDSFVQIWDSESGQAVVSRHFYGVVRRCKFVPGKPVLAVGIGDGHTFLWQPKELQSPNQPGAHGIVRRWRVHLKTVTSLAVAADGTAAVASAGRDGRLVLARPLSQHRVRKTISTGSVWDIALIPPAQVATVGNGEVAIADATSGSRVRVLADDNRQWCRVAAHHAGRWLAAADVQGEVWLWELFRENPAKRRVGGIGQQVTALEFSPEGSYLAVSGSSGHSSVSLIEAASGKLLREVEAPGCECLTFSPDSRQLWIACRMPEAASARPHRLFSWDIQSGEFQPLTPGNEGRTRSLHSGRSGRLIVSGGDDRLVRLWDSADGTLAAALSGHQAPVRSAALTPCGQTLATSDDAGVTRIWHFPSRQHLFSIRKPAYVKLAFSENGRILAGLTDRGRVVVYDTTLPEEVELSLAGAVPVDADNPRRPAE